MADEDYVEEEYTEEAGGDVSGDIDSKNQEVNDLLESGKVLDAMQAAVTDNPIVMSKDQAAKDKMFESVLRAFQAMRDADVDKLMNQLEQDQREVLLKYVYRGLAEAECCALLLKMHGKITEKDGIGAIVRVLASRKTV